MKTITIIEELFDIVYGQREYHNKEWLEGTEGQVMLISSKGEDNGVYGFFDIPIKFKAPFITVQGYGTIGHAFVQEQDCSVDDHMLILIPKTKLSLDKLYQVAYQIRLTKWKYRYGRGITPDRLKEQKIILTDSKKDWHKFEKDITPTTVKRTKTKPIEKIKIFKLKALFKVVKGQGSYLEKMEAGTTPIISTQILNNGVCGFYDIAPIFQKFSITIGRIMCNPRVQIQDFSTVPDDMFVLMPHEELPKELLFYISATIQTESWRFNYSRKATREKLENLNIPLPIKDKNIDYEYIEQVAKNSYGYNLI